MLKDMEAERIKTFMLKDMREKKSKFRQLWSVYGRYFACTQFHVRPAPIHFSVTGSIPVIYPELYDASEANPAHFHQRALQSFTFLCMAQFQHWLRSSRLPQPVVYLKLHIHYGTQYDVSVTAQEAVSLPPTSLSFCSFAVPLNKAVCAGIHFLLAFSELGSGSEWFQSGSSIGLLVDRQQTG